MKKVVTDFEITPKGQYVESKISVEYDELNRYDYDDTIEEMKNDLNQIIDIAEITQSEITVRSSSPSTLFVTQQVPESERLIIEVIKEQLDVIVPFNYKKSENNRKLIK
jgi:hypothetical protein